MRSKLWFNFQHEGDYFNHYVDDVLLISVHTSKVAMLFRNDTDTITGIVIEM